jgi:PAS domain S-box-containing protein
MEPSLRTYAESSPHGVWIADLTDTIVYANPAMSELAGVPREQIVGANVLTGFSEETIREFTPYYARAKETSQVVRYESVPVTTPTGRKTLQSGWLAPLESGGSRIGTSCTIRDVTELRSLQRSLKQREEELRRTQSILRAAMKQSPAGICIADPAGKITFINEAGLRIGGRPGEALEVGVDEYVSSWQAFHIDGRELKREEVPLARAVLYQEASTLELLVRGPDRDVPISASGAPIFDDLGNHLGGIVVFMDTTELRRAHAKERELEANLRETQRLESLGLLAGGIAHDFNNLLTIISGNVELAQAQAPEGTSLHKQLERVSTAASTAASLTNQMLVFCGRASFSVGQVDLALLLRDMKILLESSKSKKARLEVRISPNLPLVEGGAAELRQVVLNLVTNAADAIKDDGSILVEAQAKECTRSLLDEFRFGSALVKGRFVSLVVSDDGCGMGAVALERMFDPFFSTKFAGRGLGLASVLGIVQGHGGAIRVTSQLGSGTRVEVLLPTSEAVAEPLPMLEAGTSDPSSCSECILVVDDDAGVRAFGRDALSSLGFTVLEARDGKEGVEQVRGNPKVRAVLLDFQMPRMSGAEAFARMRELRPDLPIILVSGDAELEVPRLFDQGLAGFLRKPYLIKDLRGELRRVLG